MFIPLEEMGAIADPGRSHGLSLKTTANPQGLS